MAPATNADLRAQLEALTTLVQSMQTEITTLRSQVQSVTPSPPPSTVVSLEQLSKLPKEPQVSAPETFSGKEDLRIYLQQCELCFDLQPSRYPTDYQKVGLILSYLRGPAAKWARPYLSDKNHELRNDLKRFIQTIDEAYGDSDYESRAESEIRALKQTKSASSYAAEFQAIASNLSWNDGALRSQFFEGLKKTVQDEVIKSPPKTLRELIALATRIDNHQYRHRYNERQPSTSISMETHTSTTQFAKRSGGKLTDAEREAQQEYRRANGLCTYCGGAQHDKFSCPKLLQKKSAAEITSITLPRITYPPYEERN
jgi:hypothetical protein